VTLKTKLSIDLVALLTGSLDLQGLSAPAGLKRVYSLDDGAGANQANRLWSDRRTIAASGSEDIDLAGSLTDAFGAALTFARIKALVIAAAAGNSNDVQVTRPASNGAPLFMAAGDGIALHPGACLCWVDPSAAGVVVTAGTGDLLHVTNSGAGTGVTYDIVIIGAAS
jgi:hypothetical protein